MRRLIALAGAVVLVTAGPAFAQADTPGANLGGYDGLSSSMAFSFQPFLPALLSTGDVPFESTFALANSRVKSGGNAFGHAALIWPGSTAADLGPVLGVAFGQPEVGALIPKWPLQASATQDDGEVVTGVDPIAVMRATGYPNKATGDSRVADVHVPGLLQIEHIASTSSSIVTDSSVTSTARVALQGVSLLKGFIKIESIRSTSITSSIGSAASSSGDVDISGMKIGGIDVSVTDDGFQVNGLPSSGSAAPGAGGEPFPGTSPEETVNQILAALGSRITLFNSIEKVRGGQAEHLEPGVIISVNNPVGGTGPIPPGRFDIVLGSSSSSSLATLPFSFNAPAVERSSGGSGGASSGGSPSISIGSGPKVGGETVSNVGDELSGAPSGALGSAPQGLGDLTPQRSDYRFTGVPLALVIGLLLLSLLLARYLRGFLAGLIATSDDQGDDV